MSGLETQGIMRERKMVVMGGWTRKVVSDLASLLLKGYTHTLQNIDDGTCSWYRKQDGPILQFSLGIRLS